MRRPLSLILAIVILLATIPFAGVAQAMTGVELTPALARNDMVPLNGEYTYDFDEGGTITILVMQNTPRPGWNTITWSTTGVQLTEVTIHSSGRTSITTSYDPASYGPYTIVAKKNQILGMTFRGIPDKTPTYTVTFDKNGGDTEANPTSISGIVSGGNVGTLPIPPTKIGYNFTGWNTSADGSRTAFTASTAVTASITAYAQWTALPTAYTVTYDGNTNTGGMVPVDGDSPYLAGATVTVLGNTGTLTKTGFTFAGWNTMANGSGTAYAGGATFPMPAANVTLYAQWAALPTAYTVTYDGNTNTGGMVPVDGDSPYLTGATVTVLGNIGTLTKTGFTFAGWNTMANGSGTAYAGGATFPMPAANVTLYAQWTALPTYTVTYLPGTQGTFATQSTSGLLEGVATPAAPTVTGNVGYTFTGWSPIPTVTVTGDATYTALWAALTTTYTVTFLPGTQGTFATQSTSGLLEGATTPTPPTVTGNELYNFTGWIPTVSATVTGNATYTAQWVLIIQPTTYTVTYAPGTQGTFATQTNSGLSFGATTPPPPTVTGNVGYDFVGWSPIWSATVIGNVTYTAQWSLTTEPTTYTVTYTPGTQGTFATQTKSGLSFGTATPQPPTVTGNAGYDFLGWNPTWSATVVGNVTYTAQWSLTTEPTTYAVTYAPGTQGTFATQTFSGLTFGTTTPTPPTATGNAGYTFSGWSPAVAATVTASVTYTAQWEPIFYTVVVNAGIGGSATGGGTFISGSIVTVVATAEADYDNDGWYENGVLVSSNASYSFFVLRDRILDAEFAAEVPVIEPPAGPGLPDPIIPGAPELPATGELPFTIFYGIGSIITLAGIVIGRRRRKQHR